VRRFLNPVPFGSICSEHAGNYFESSLGELKLGCD